MPRKKILNHQELIEFIYKLLLNRIPDPGGLEAHKKSLKSGSCIENFIKFVLDCSERTELIEKNPLYIPNNININICDIVFTLKRACVDKKYTSIIISEFYIFKKNYSRAIKIFKLNDCYESWNENIRFLKLASETNFLDYTWCLHRTLNYYHTPDNVCKKYIASENIFIAMQKKIFSPNELLKKVLSNRAILADAMVDNIVDNYEFYDKNRIKDDFKISCNLRILPAKVTQKCMEILDVIDNGEYISTIPENKAVLTFIGGFRHSGSSAIYDFLRSNQECCDAFENILFPYSWEKEITFFICQFSFADIVNNINKNNIKKYLILFLFKQLLSYHIPYNSAMHCIRSYFMIGSGSMYSESSYIEYLDICKTLYMRINNAIINKNMSLPDIFSAFLTELGKYFTKKISNYILLNNTIPVYDFDKLRLIPYESIYIMCARDPRDQYISLNKYYSCSLEDYIKMMKYQLKIIEQNFDELSLHYNIIPVSFERFVNEKSYRDLLIDRIGIKGEFPSIHFAPEKSAKNIGKYLNFEDQEAIKKIEQEFPHLIDRSWLKNFATNIE